MYGTMLSNMEAANLEQYAAMLPTLLNRSANLSYSDLKFSRPSETMGLFPKQVAKRWIIYFCINQIFMAQSSDYLPNVDLSDLRCFKHYLINTICQLDGL